MLFLIIEGGKTRNGLRNAPRFHEQTFVLVVPAHYHDDLHVYTHAHKKIISIVRHTMMTTCICTYMHNKKKLKNNNPAHYHDDLHGYTHAYKKIISIVRHTILTTCVCTYMHIKNKGKKKQSGTLS
jgi:hypothetical protein